ncbi:MAG TPA: TadE/TadG family type IV pilus assembly protein [Alphaproteobacteria bacterium]
MTRFVRDRRGLTLVEFAFLVPVMTAITLCSIEIGRYALLNQKLQNAATSMADLAARDGALTVAQLDSLFAAVPSITQPFDFENQGRAIVTSVHADEDGDPEVYWQRGGGGTLTATSLIGAPGNNANIPPELPARAGDTIIVAEIFYEYHPLFDILLEQKVLRRTAYVRPRIGLLTTLDP